MALKAKVRIYRNIIETVSAVTMYLTHHPIINYIKHAF